MLLPIWTVKIRTLCLYKVVASTRNFWENWSAALWVSINHICVSVWVTQIYFYPATDLCSFAMLHDKVPIQNVEICCEFCGNLKWSYRKCFLTQKSFFILMVWLKLPLSARCRVGIRPWNPGKFGAISFISCSTGMLKATDNAVTPAKVIQWLWQSASEHKVVGFIPGNHSRILTGA